MAEPATLPSGPAVCQACGQAGPLRRLRVDLAGQAHGLDLCAACAGRLGINPPSSDLPPDLSDLFGAMLDQRAWLARDARSCPACATRFASIRRTGRVGCMGCYETFGGDIRSLLPRLGGRQTHSGQLPARLDAWRQVLQATGPVSQEGGQAQQSGGQPKDVSGLGDAPIPDLRTALGGIVGDWLPAAQGWRLQAITHDPLVVSTGLVMYRNAMDFAFPARLSKLDGMRLLAMAERFFRGQDMVGQAGEGLQRQFANGDGGLGCELNGTDHFRLWHSGFGGDWPTGLAGLHQLESGLERVTPFAVNLEWGHLSASLANLGTALRAEAWLHLPAWTAEAASTNLPPGLADLIPDGLLIQADRLPGVWRLSNRRTLGWSEALIFAELARTGRILLHYEETLARKSWQADPVTVEDRLWRLWGSLGQCRRLGLQELMDGVAALRQGLYAGVFSGDGHDGGPVHWQLNALLQLMQVQNPGNEREDDPQDQARARLVRALLALAG